jgi:lipooligosaccharide transport system permease protein
MTVPAITTPSAPTRPGGGPPRFPALRVVEYCARVYRRNWRGTMFMTFFSPVLFLTAMGAGLGSFVDSGDAAARTLGGVPYAMFLAPGLLAASAMQIGSFETTYPIMARFRWNRVYHAMLSTPIGVGSIVLGQVGWIALRLTLITGVFLAVMVAFGLVAGPLGLLAIIPGVMTGLSFATPIMAFTATRRTDEGFSTIFRFVVIPLYLFSGTFFPLEQLPDPLQVLAWLTPTAHGVALARDLTLGRAELIVSLAHAGFLALVIGIGLVAAVVTFRRALRE